MGGGRPEDPELTGRALRIQQGSFAVEKGTRSRTRKAIHLVKLHPEQASPGLDLMVEAAGLSEGELWQRLEGSTVSPQVSPDGSKILARRDPRRRESYLAVWTTEETEEERRAEEGRDKRVEELLKDVNEVSEKVVLPRPEEPKTTIGSPLTSRVSWR